MKRIFVVVSFFVCTIFCSDVFAQFGADSLRVNDFFVVTDDDGDTLFVIKGGGSTQNITIYGDTERPPSLYFKTREDQSDEIWDIGAVNTDGSFFIGNFSKSASYINTDTTGTTNIPFLLRRTAAHAISWLPHGTDVDLDTTQFVDEYYSIPFTSSLDSTLSYSFDLPDDSKGTIDSVKIKYAFASTSGDSSSHFLRRRKADVGGLYTLTTLVTCCRDTTDYGTTSNIIREITFIPNWTGLAGERVVIEYCRDNSIANNMAISEKFLGGIIYWH